MVKVTGSSQKLHQIQSVRNIMLSCLMHSTKPEKFNKLYERRRNNRDNNENKQTARIYSRCLWSYRSVYRPRDHVTIEGGTSTTFKNNDIMVTKQRSQNRTVKICINDCAVDYGSLAMTAHTDGFFDKGVIGCLMTPTSKDHVFGNESFKTLNAK